MIVLFAGCSQKEPIKTESFDILFKTKNLKFNDKGFINKFYDYTQLQIYNAGFVVLDLKIYDDKVCKGLLQCQDIKTFNLEQFGTNYQDNFLRKLFENINENGIFYKDAKNGIIIRATKEEL